MVVHNLTWKDRKWMLGGTSLERNLFIFFLIKRSFNFNLSGSKVFLCNVSGFRYNALLLGTNIDRDYGSFLDFCRAIRPHNVWSWLFYLFKIMKKKKNQKKKRIKIERCLQFSFSSHEYQVQTLLSLINVLDTHQTLMCWPYFLQWWQFWLNLDKTATFV